MGHYLCRNGRNVKYVRIANINPIITIWDDATLIGDTAEVCRAVLDIATVEYEGRLPNHAEEVYGPEGEKEVNVSLKNSPVIVETSVS